MTSYHSGAKLRQITDLQRDSTLPKGPDRMGVLDVSRGYIWAMHPGKQAGGWPHVSHNYSAPGVPTCRPNQHRHRATPHVSQGNPGKISMDPLASGSTRRN